MRFKKLIKSPFLWAFLIGIASLHLIKEMALRNRHAPKPLVYVEDWQLIDEEGRNFSKNNTKGKVVVADFFFTSCPSICPKLTGAMKEIYSRFSNKSEQVEFLSFTVDPEVDTPIKLKEFMIKNQINHKNWHALTGTKKAIYEVVVEKMHIHVGDQEELAQGIYDIPHLGQLALFDQDGNLRGLFATESLEMAALVRAIDFLLIKSLPLD